MNIVLIGKLWEFPAACLFPHHLAQAKDMPMWAVIHAWVGDVMNTEIHVSEQFICMLGPSDVHFPAENVRYWSRSTRIEPLSKWNLVAEFHRLVSLELTKNSHSIWFQTFAMFWMLYSFFWVGITQKKEYNNSCSSIRNFFLCLFT